MTERPTFCQEIRGIVCDDCELRTIGEAFWEANAKDSPYYTAQQLKDALLHEVRENDTPDDPSLVTAGYLNKFSQNIVALVPGGQAIIPVNGTLSVGEQSAYLDNPLTMHPTPPEAQMVFNCFARNQREGCTP